MEITVEILEEKFEEYNKLYFGGRLLWPYEFYLISMYYDWTEEYLRDVLVHEMLHYKLERSKNVEKKMHGPRFRKAAAEMNEKYGLNIQVHPTLLELKVSATAPKRSLARFFWAPAS